MVPLASGIVQLELPQYVQVLEPQRVSALRSVADALSFALTHPTGAPPLAELARERIERRSDAAAVIVVSDSTRPVPYTGASGVLWPILEQLLLAGFRSDRVTVLVATGTHRPLTAKEIQTLFDERVTGSGVSIRCHDAFDADGLVNVGKSTAGLDVLMDRGYVQADLRILTGLVESHLMAGVSGGRKSICPGLLSVESVRDFHGPSVLAHPSATDLVTSGNPCHELSLEIARMAPADFILNVTATEAGVVTGVYAGHMEQAHESAVQELRRSVSIPLSRLYDVVVTHGGKVGVNHYQSAKAAAIASRAVRPGGRIVIVSDTTDPDPVGSMHYRALMTLLKAVGHEAFERLLLSPDWSFVPDQWQAQMWVRVLKKIQPHHVYYYSPQTPLFEYDRLPCRSLGEMWSMLQEARAERRMALFVSQALNEIFAALSVGDEGRSAATGAAADAADASYDAHRPSLAFLPAGPYGVPVPGPELVADNEHQRRTPGVRR